MCIDSTRILQWHLQTCSIKTDISLQLLMNIRFNRVLFLNATEMRDSGGGM